MVCDEWTDRQMNSKSDIEVDDPPKNCSMGITHTKNPYRQRALHQNSNKKLIK